MATIAINKGRYIHFIGGISGVSPGGQAVVNLPVNMRYHRLVFQCKAINFTGGTALTTTVLTGAGNNALTVTPAVVHGVITSLAIVAGGTGYAVNDTFRVNDTTGQGFVGRVSTISAGAVTAAVVVSPGIATPISPRVFFTSVKMMVNGVNMRDISAENMLRISMASGCNPFLGELPVYFTAPWRNVNQQNEVTSWDLFGQSTFQAQLGISPNLSLPSLSAVMEFDYMRNTRPDGRGNPIPFLQPTAQHQFTWPIVAGRNDINTLPFMFPISRIWLSGSVPRAISQVEISHDGNKVAEYTVEQLHQVYGQYGFTFGRPDCVNLAYAASPALQAAYEAPSYFDAAFISDPDQRWWKALKATDQLIVRVVSDVSQTLTLVQETLPGSFSS